MKTIVILMVAVAAVSAMPQFGGGQQSVRTGGARSISQGGGLGGGVGARRPLGPTNPKSRYSAKFYGPGLENPYAFPVNQFVASNAEQIVSRAPGTLVRVDLNGELSITDQFGQEVDGIYDQWGRDLTDLID